MGRVISFLLVAGLVFLVLKTIAIAVVIGLGVALIYGFLKEPAAMIGFVALLVLYAAFKAQPALFLIGLVAVLLFAYISKKRTPSEALSTPSANETANDSGEDEPPSAA